MRVKLIIAPGDNQRSGLLLLGSTGSYTRRGQSRRRDGGCGRGSKTLDFVCSTHTYVVPAHAGFCSPLPFPPAPAGTPARLCPSQLPQPPLRDGLWVAQAAALRSFGKCLRQAVGWCILCPEQTRFVGIHCSLAC